MPCLPVVWHHQRLFLNERTVRSLNIYRCVDSRCSVVGTVPGSTSLPSPPEVLLVDIYHQTLRRYEGALAV